MTSFMDDPLSILFQEKADEGITVVVKAEVKEESASDVILAEPSVHRQVIQVKKICSLTKLGIFVVIWIAID